MTNAQLMQLREDITLGSVYLFNYHNRFRIDTDTVCTFFDGFLDYLEEMMQEEIPDYDDAHFFDYLPDYDNADNLENWYLMFEDDPLPMPVFMKKVVTLFDWEGIPENDDDAIQHMKNWDYGENYHDDITLDDVKRLNGTIAIRGEYVLYRKNIHKATLYRICA